MMVFPLSALSRITAQSVNSSECPGLPSTQSHTIAEVPFPFGLSTPGVLAGECLTSNYDGNLTRKPWQSGSHDGSSSGKRQTFSFSYRQHPYQQTKTSPTPKLTSTTTDLTSFFVRNPSKASKVEKNDPKKKFQLFSQPRTTAIHFSNPRKHDNKLTNRKIARNHHFEQFLAIFTPP